MEYKNGLFIRLSDKKLSKFLESFLFYKKIRYIKMKSDFFTLQTKDKRIEKNVLYVKLRVEKHKNIVYNNVEILHWRSYA